MRPETLDYRRLADLMNEAERALDDRARRPLLALRRDLTYAAIALHAYASGQDSAADAEEGARDRYGSTPNRRRAPRRQTDADPDRFQPPGDEGEGSDNGA